MKKTKDEVMIPGSKSLTNRALIMASLADGTSVIKGYSKSDDSLVLIKALRKLGVVIVESGDRLKIIGNAGQFKVFNGRLDVGNAGTAMRFLTSLVTLVPGRVVVKGSKRMRERPIKELISALARIKTGKVSVKGSISSQFISSFLMIAPVLEKGLVIKIINRLVSKSYVDMTIDLLNKFGVKVVNYKYKKFVIGKNQKLKPVVYEVEGDATAASYFWAVAAVTGSKIKVKNINSQSKQGDLKFLEILKNMGCLIEKNTKEKWITVKGPLLLKAVNVDMESMPDSAQTLAVVAAFAKGKTKITGLSTLKIKETDRLTALKNELKKIGIKSKITNDSITVHGGKPHGAVIKTYNDHRMAMAFAVAKAKIPGLIIKNPEVVKKSFPDFWEKFNQL